VATQQASIAATAASIALPPASKISFAASAAAGWGVATAAVAAVWLEFVVSIPMDTVVSGNSI
jgi:hypothetical protein